MTVTIWHNPRCSKSRETLAILRDQDLEPAVRLYLKDPPSEQEIRNALTRLGIAPLDLMRKGEARFRELGLGLDVDNDTLVAAMAAEPILIERPVVFAGDRAIIGRPPRAVLDIL